MHEVKVFPENSMTTACGRVDATRRMSGSQSHAAVPPKTKLVTLAVPWAWTTWSK
jgi:hypothetical protein